MPSVLRTCRRLLRELNRVESGAWKGSAWRYIAHQVRNPSCSSSLTGNLHLLENYLTYVQSSREHRELLARYQGRGERSVEESARLVGLDLPEQTASS